MSEKDFNPHDIKALAFDMDGTLLRPDKSLGERTLEALSACTERGIHLILATGRGCESVEPYRKQINATGPQVYYNGAEVLDMPGGTQIHLQLLDLERARFCFELSRKKNLYYQAYFPARTLSPGIFAEAPETDGSGRSSGASETGTPAGSGAPDLNREILLTETLCAESDYYRKTSGLQALAGDVEKALAEAAQGPAGIIKCMFITEEKEQEGIREAVKERFGDSVYVVRSSPLYLEILSKEVSKGSGFLHALAYLGIDPKHSVAFGDEENDLSMLAAAGFSAAPENSTRAVKEAATFQIPSNADDGVAAFIEERILR
ncbi:MAG: Cof-type HAD-IIB family hydrolase [Spirochaetales bacterium]|nr:Cof-type HAD-IIB family hydrolase [Spirochaetales bacterium]